MTAEVSLRPVLKPSPPKQATVTDPTPVTAASWHILFMGSGQVVRPPQGLLSCPPTGLSLSVS